VLASALLVSRGFLALLPVARRAWTEWQTSEAVFSYPAGQCASMEDIAADDDLLSDMLLE
jgi:hypothetical protein